MRWRFSSCSKRCLCLPTGWCKIKLSLPSHRTQSALNAEVAPNIACVSRPGGAKIKPSLPAFVASTWQSCQDKTKINKCRLLRPLRSLRSLRSFILLNRKVVIVSSDDSNSAADLKMDLDRQTHQAAMAQITKNLTPVNVRAVMDAADTFAGKDSKWIEDWLKKVERKAWPYVWPWIEPEKSDNKRSGMPWADMEWDCWIQAWRMAALESRNQEFILRKNVWRATVNKGGSAETDKRGIKAILCNGQSSHTQQEDRFIAWGRHDFLLN